MLDKKTYRDKTMFLSVVNKGVSNEMKVKELREKALKKANEIESEARADNRNCLLMPIYQACLSVVHICDDGLRGRSDKEAEEMADALAAKINLGSK